MNKALGLFIIITVSLAVISCAYPMGQTHADGSSADVDDFWTIPKRTYYTLGNNFVKEKDLRAFASAQGLVATVPAGSVEISLVTNPDAPNPAEPIPIETAQYRLVASIVGTGTKKVIVKYGGMTDEYRIEVRYPDGSGDDEPGGDGGAGIGIIWSK